LSKVCIILAVSPVDGSLRIGELSRRSGVSPELLRAWERRYGLLRPARSSGGLRLYSPDDLERVRLMRHHLAEGLAAAEAAALAGRATLAGEDAGQPALRLPAAREELADALERFEEARAHAVIDRVLAIATVDALIGEVVLPYLHDLGTRWERGEASIAHEHFATSLLRGRLLGLARGWGLGLGPVALLACLPGEQHDLGLIAFGLALRARGWRIVYLGSDAPVESIAEAGRELDPSLVVVSAVSSDRMRDAAGELEGLGRRFRLALGGPAAHGAVPDVAGLLRLTGDPVTEADRMTAMLAGA
jgi:MerR family transcriptional regulator, light-induced transcriptional regulator